MPALQNTGWGTPPVKKGMPLETPESYACRARVVLPILVVRGRRWSEDCRLVQQHPPLPTRGFGNNDGGLGQLERAAGSGSLGVLALSPPPQPPLLAPPRCRVGSRRAATPHHKPPGRMICAFFFFFKLLISLTQQTHTLAAQRTQRKRCGYLPCLGVGDTFFCFNAMCHVGVG